MSERLEIDLTPAKRIHEAVAELNAAIRSAREAGFEVHASVMSFRAEPVIVRISFPC